MLKNSSCYLASFIPCQATQVSFHLTFVVVVVAAAVVVIVVVVVVAAVVKEFLRWSCYK